MSVYLILIELTFVDASIRKDELSHSALLASEEMASVA